METSSSTYREILLADFNARVETNPSYSRRAYAKRLGVSPAFLTQVLNGRRNLSAQVAEKIATRLEWSVQKRRRFFGLLREEAGVPTGSVETEMVRVDYLDVMERIGRRAADEIFSNVAALKLLEAAGLSDAKADPVWLAARADCSVEDARRFLGLYLELGFFKIDGETNGLRMPAGIYLTNAPYAIIRERESAFLRHFLKNVGVNQPFFNAVLPVNPEKLAAAREIMMEAAAKIASVLAEGERTELMSFVVGLAPTSPYRAPLNPPHCPVEMTRYDTMRFPKKKRAARRAGAN